MFSLLTQQEMYLKIQTVVTTVMRVWDFLLKTSLRTRMQAETQVKNKQTCSRLTSGPILMMEADRQEESNKLWPTKSSA
jgi:hypothetical protein